MESNPQIQLVSPLETRNFTTAQDAKMVNCFADQVGISSYGAVKRSGLSPFFQGQPGCGQGLYNFENVLYSVSGDTLNINAVSTSNFHQTTNSAGWSARTGMSGAGFNGFLWAMNGLNSDGTTYNSDVWKSADGVSWTQVIPGPWSPRAYGQTIVFNDMLWVLGGVGPSNTYLGDVWSSPDGVIWTQLDAAAWPGRANFGVTVFNNLLWVVGGQGGGPLDNGTCGNDIWSSVDGIAWVSVLATAPWVARSRFGFAGFNNRLRVLGGYMGPFAGAGVDEWSSADGINWTRDDSNPFTQAATGVFPLAAMTSLGFSYDIAPIVTLSGGGGSGATAFGFIDGFEEDGADDYDGPMNISITAGGSGYTQAPDMTFTVSAGIAPSGYTFLKANGVAGDKRGMFAITSSTLYFMTFTNNGAFSDEIWQSTDGVTWSIYQSAPTYGPRDAYGFYFGSLWVLSGANSTAAGNTDVWEGGFVSGSSLPLDPTVNCLPVSFSQTSASLTHPLLFFKTNTDAYTYNADLGVLFKINDLDYPPLTVPGIVYLDTYFFVMDNTGKIYNSNNNDPTVWTALGEIPLQNEPNGGAALGKVGQYLVAFGQWSTQFFYDNAVAAPASPLAVNGTLDSLVGCASGDSVVQMQSTVFWIGQNRSEGRGVFNIQNLIPTRVSTPFIDRLLENDNLSDVRSFATGQIGHSFYVLTLINTGITLVLDCTTQNWTVFTSLISRVGTVITSLTSTTYGTVLAQSAGHGLLDGDPITVTGASNAGYNGSFNAFVTDPNFFTYQIPAGLPPASGATVTGYSQQYFTGRGSASASGEYYIQHENNGEVYLFSQSNTTDFSNPIDVRVRTGNWDAGTPHWKTFTDIDLLADNNNSSCLLRSSDDDYQTYSFFRAIDLSITRKHLSRGGRSRRRAFELRHTAATPFRAFLLELTPEVADF